jgi:hypothetical protein
MLKMKSEKLTPENSRRVILEILTATSNRDILFEILSAEQHDLAAKKLDIDMAYENAIDKKLFS